MTQPMREPRAPWIVETIERYLGDEKNKFQPYRPLTFDVERSPFDPSAFYRELDTFKTMSRNATNNLKQALEAKRQRELQEAMRASQAAGPGIQAPAYMGSTSKGQFGRPLPNYSVSSGYGSRTAPTAGATSWHNGVDLAAPMGTPIYATHDGVVQFAGFNNGYGNHIYLSAGNGVTTFYGHNSRNVVSNGQRIRKGQLIGYVGSTGVSTGPHLHYGVQVNGSWVNPAGYY